MKEAFEYWKDDQIDMVILDINLPDGSGYGFLESVRKESQIPVIMLTANDMDRKARCIKRKDTDFPLTARNLLWREDLLN